jgi:hypothetical protein
LRCVISDIQGNRNLRLHLEEAAKGRFALASLTQRNHELIRIALVLSMGEYKAKLIRKL